MDRQQNIITRLIMGIVVVMFFVSPLLGAGTNKDKNVKVELDTFFVDRTIADLTKKFKDEEKKKTKLSVPVLVSFGVKFARFAKHPDIEKETMVYRSWYSDIGKLCTAMGNLKYRYYAAKSNKDAELIQKCGTQYIAYRTKCLKLLENPREIKKSQLKKRH